MQLPKFLIFSLEKICFLVTITSNHYLNKTGCSLIDLDVFFSDAIIGIYKITEFWKSEFESEFKISISIHSYYEKTADNYQNGCVAEKPIVAKLSKISIPIINSTN